MGDNFKFLYFKSSGKWYTEGRGHVSQECFDKWHLSIDRTAFWQQLINENGGVLPGLSVSCTNLTIVMVPDEGTHGWPLIFVGGHDV